MKRTALLLAASVGCAVAAGCNAILGICDGAPTGGTGGAAGSSGKSGATSSSSGTGGPASSSSGTGGTGGGNGGSGTCDPDSGQTSFAWAPPMGQQQASLAQGSTSGSEGVPQQSYSTLAGVSTFAFQAGENTATYKDMQVLLVLTGKPTTGKMYTVADGATCDGSLALMGGDYACLQLQETPTLADGGFAPQQTFASVAGSGTVTVTSATKIGPNNDVQLTAMGVVLAGVASTGATGSLAFMLGADAQCFQYGP
jgi:hypothetical protein